MQKKLLVEASLTFSRAVETAQSIAISIQAARDVNHLASIINTCYRCGHCSFKKSMSQLWQTRAYSDCL